MFAIAKFLVASLRELVRDIAMKLSMSTVNGCDIVPLNVQLAAFALERGATFAALC